MAPAFVGPLPIRRFFDDFLPVENVPPLVTTPGFASMTTATSEREMHGFFVGAANSLFTAFTAFDTSNIPSVSEVEAEYNPKVTIHDREKGPPTSTITTYQTMEMFIEFGLGEESDPFRKKGGVPKRPLQHTAFDLPRLVFKFTRQQFHQFRTWTFAVAIFGNVARILRLDRTGCQVTVPIHYSTEEGNRHLTEFFLRFDRMANDPEARGWDTTVTDATVEEDEDFTELVDGIREGRTINHGGDNTEDEPMVYPVLDLLLGTIRASNDYPRRKVSIMYGEVSREYVIGHPFSIPGLPVGRDHCRGFVAMSVQTKRLVFLKDNWRVDTKNTPPEDHWYQLLSQKRGCTGRIAAYLHGSDVYATKRLVRCTDLKQRTVTHLYARELRQGRGLMGYIHNRVVFSELYVPLQTFRDSRHLTDIMLDIAEALQFIHRAGVFHCDLGITNIMLDIYGYGRLIDFDAAQLKEPWNVTEGGTWQFVSTRKLLHPNKAYEVSDELESMFFIFFHVGLYLVINNKPDGLNINDIFNDLRLEPNGRQIRGSGKLRMYLVDPDVVLQQLEFQKSPPFTGLIRELFRLFQCLVLVDTLQTAGRPASFKDVTGANKLKDCKAIIRLIKNATGRSDWPHECDRVGVGNRPRSGPVDPPVIAPAPPAPLDPVTNANGAPKRGREEDESDEDDRASSKAKTE